MDRVIAIIPSAGRGLRMSSMVEKPYILLNGRPILAHTLDVFEQCHEVDGVVVVVEPDKVSECRAQVVAYFGYTKVLDIIAGGLTRQESVYRGLQWLGSHSVMVIVHDAARPLILPELIRETIRVCHRDGAALVAVPVKDTVKIVRNRVVESTPDRSTVWLAQTPQTFSTELLKEAHERALREAYVGTDDSSLVERMGHPVSVVPGTYENLKITTPEDLDLAEQILQRRMACA